MRKKKNHSSDSFAKRLDQLMKAGGWTQKSLGARIGAGQSAVFNWLNGTVPSAGQLLRLSSVLGRSMEWLLQGTTEREPTANEIGAKAVHELPADTLRAALRKIGWSPDQWAVFVAHMNTQKFALAIQGNEIVMRPAAETNLAAPDNGLRSALALDLLKGKSLAVESEIALLIDRVNAAVAAPGKKTELARLLGVAPARITEWLTRKKEPGGEYTLRLLRWVMLQERTMSNPAGSTASGGAGESS